MDIKEKLDYITKTCTREEFLKGCTENEFTSCNISCPEDIGLKNINADYCKRSNCIACWKEAIENIKFKGEDDMKEYKTYEVIKILELNSNRKFYDRIGRIIENMSGAIVVKYKDEESILDINEKWKLLQEPMYFMEAVNSKRKMKLGSWNGYYNLKDSLSILSNSFDYEITKYLNKKCWYLEED